VARARDKAAAAAKRDRVMIYLLMGSVGGRNVPAGSRSLYLRPKKITRWVNSS
jgi:hypothetical protein